MNESVPDASGGTESESRPVAEAYRYCPRCAAENPRLGSVPFKCPRCGFSEYFGPVAAVGGIIVNARSEMLFVRRSRNPGKGKWGLPGGFIDPEETGEQAVIREIAEETGLNVTQLRFLLTLPNRYDHHGVVAPVIDLFYVAHVDAERPVRLARDELDAFEWSHPNARYLENMAFLSNRLAVEYWLEHGVE